MTAVVNDRIFMQSNKQRASTAPETMSVENSRGRVQASTAPSETVMIEPKDQLAGRETAAKQLEHHVTHHVSGHAE